MRDLYEVVPIQDIFSSGMGTIERLEGGCLRFWFYVTQTRDDGTRERVVTARIVAPTASVADAVMQMIAVLGDHATTLAPVVADLLH